MDDTGVKKSSGFGQWPAILLSLFAGGIVGALVWTTPIGQGLETELGLSWLFKLRGPRAAAPEVLVIPIDNQAATALSQPPIHSLDRWDRSLFATLIDRLAAAGASVIAFDVAFLEQGKDPRADELLSAAISRAGNVVLLAWLDQQRPDALTGSPVVLNLDRLTGPIAKLADAARAVAPWPLYKDARTNRFPTYPVIAGTPRPTLPLVALHLYKRSDIDLLRRCSGVKPLVSHSDAPPKASDEILLLRQALHTSPMPATAPCADPALRSLAASYLENAEIFFNYFGPPGTLVASPLHHWLASDTTPPPLGLKEKAVFIGVADYSAVQQTDSFYTIYRSDRGNRDISGVELAANAFANLLHRDHLQPVGALAGLVILLLFGALIGVPAYRLPAKIAVAAVLALSGTYVFAALSLFSQQNLWLPLAIPLLIQMPLAIALGWRLRYLRAKRLKEAYRGAVEHYVPPHIAERIEQVGHIGIEPEPRYAICMHSDIAGYTALAERLGSDPAAFKALENEYWELIGEEILQESGQMLEIAGDGMSAVWAAEEPSPALQARACRAAIRMLRAVDRFNLHHPDTPFPTRIGMHAGRVALGNVGGGGHYTWAVGGDIATTAARLENDLNKLMGTCLAISEEALNMLPEQDKEPFRFRYLGRYILQGKRADVQVFEPLTVTEHGSGLGDEHLRWYEAGLTAFHSGDWGDAEYLFEKVLFDRPADGPSAFYRRLSDHYLKKTQQPPHPDMPGLIDMNAHQP